MLLHGKLGCSRMMSIIYILTKLNPSLPGGGGVPWKDPGIRPVRAKLPGISPYGTTVWTRIHFDQLTKHGLPP